MKKMLIIVMLIILVGALSKGIHSKLLVTINTEDVIVNIQSGEHLRDISNKLKKNGVIYSAEAFIIYTKLKGQENDVLAGNFVVPPHTKLDELLTILQNPELEYSKFTIPEGYTVYQIAKKLEENQLANKEEFLKRTKERSDIVDETNNTKYTIYNLEGYLFPDTYYIPTGFTEEEIITLTLNRMNEVIKDEYIKRGNELGLNINEVLTIASLIEKEAANDEERSRIAGVIYNRLDNGMPLQIDASVIYGITKGESHINRLLYKDLESSSLYNTYKYKGLPPGPIGSPGKASIEAALYPDEHDYLYYVLNKTGTEHLFSKTFSQHIQNKNRLK